MTTQRLESLLLVNIVLPKFVISNDFRHASMWDNEIFVRNKMHIGDFMDLM